MNCKLIIKRCFLVRMKLLDNDVWKCSMYYEILFFCFYLVFFLIFIVDFFDVDDVFGRD